MRNVNVTVDFDEVTLFTENLKKKAAFTTSWAINRVIPRTTKYLKNQMNTQLEGGALGFTKSGLQYDKASYKFSNLKTRSANTGVIYFEKKRFYMKEVISGGTKRARNKRIPEPITKNIRLTKAGNIPRNFQQQAIANQTQGFKRLSFYTKRKVNGRTVGPVLTSSSRKRFKDIWVGTPQPPLKGPYGIYKNDKKGGPPKLMVMYKRGKRNQRKIWDARTQAFKHFNRLIPVALQQSYERYIIPPRLRKRR